MPPLLDLYLKYHLVEGHTAADIKFYRKEVGLFLRFLEDHGHTMLPGDVAPDDVLGHLADLMERGRKPRTVRSRRQALMTFFNRAEEIKLIDENPVQTKAPKIPRRPKSSLKPEHLEKLLDLCPVNTFLGARDQSIIWLLLTSGTRLGELTQINLEDLDWERGRIRVVYGKGQKQRYVEFHTRAQQAILRYTAQRRDDQDCLWATENGRPLSCGGMENLFKRLLVRAGIRDEIQDGFHIFRRTWAANAVEQGVPRPYVQGGGWSSPFMLDHYVQAMQEEGDKTIEKFREIDPVGKRLSDTP